MHVRHKNVRKISIINKLHILTVLLVKPENITQKDTLKINLKIKKGDDFKNMILFIHLNDYVNDKSKFNQNS